MLRGETQEECARDVPLRYQHLSLQPQSSVQLSAVQKAEVVSRLAGSKATARRAKHKSEGDEKECVLEKEDTSWVEVESLDSDTSDDRDEDEDTRRRARRDPISRIQAFELHARAA